MVHDRLALVSLALRILPPLPMSRRRIWNAKIGAHCEMQWRLHITPTKATAEGFHTEDIRSLGPFRLKSSAKGLETEPYSALKIQACSIGFS